MTYLKLLKVKGLTWEFCQTKGPNWNFQNLKD